ncbi:MAG: type II CRISPR RNA-guided endonuclease Cas9, partial [Clostridia bacterium]
MALSELNKLKIDDVLIDVDLKKAIFDKVYLKGKANKKRIAEFLKEKGYEKFKLSGFDEELKGNMDNYQLFKKYLGDKVDKYPDMIERIIFLMTVHTESGMIGASIEKEFGGKDGILTQEEINEIKGIKFKGWGRLSAEFLNGTNYEKGLKFVDSTGELKSILDLLYDTNENMMQIINNPKYQFKKLLDQYYIDCNIIETNEISYQDVEEMYCSPSVKRCVWQTFLVVKELVKETGSIPQKVFIEVTRKPAEKKNKVKSVPRRQQIENAYKEAQKISKALQKEQMEHCLEQLKDLPSGELNKEKIFLYFMQLGKCAYSNQPIGDLSNLHDYDIDHIIPQAKKKDDSLNNKVLVRGNLNKNKADIYPLPQNLRDGGKALWDNLHKMKLMSDEKYSRLVRTAQITSDEQEKFINRQLVETNQTALLVNELLERWFNGRADKPVEIVLSKASNVSDFRKEYG